MKIQAQPVTLDDLMAYVDGQLDAEKRQQIELAISMDTQLAAHVAEMRAQRQALRNQFDPVLNEPVPPRLLAGKRSSALAAWSKAASVVAWVAVAAITGSAIPTY